MATYAAASASRPHSSRSSISSHTAAVATPDQLSVPEAAQHRFPVPPAQTVPRFVVNLSLPPEKRYTHIVPHFAEQLSALPALYDDLLRDVLPARLAAAVARGSRWVLRRLYSREETRELRGLATATGVPLHVLVAFNVLLDLFMGCTSGGVRVRGIEGDRMLHFRALDWGMDPLRRIVMEVDFVWRAGGPPVATSITYLGYVGVLTGVRPGLSMSLNFRPHHDGRTLWRHLRYGAHLLLVLLGRRRSISSVLRGYLLPPQDQAAPDLDALLADFRPQPCTAAYLIFSDGQRTVTLEKDNGSGATFSDTDFQVTLNHDVADEPNPTAVKETAEQGAGAMAATGMEELVGFSIERKECAVALYDAARKRRRRRGLPELPLEEEDVVGWMEGDQIVNEETHYATIMDPRAGAVLWAQQWLKPIDPKTDGHALRAAARRRQAAVKDILEQRQLQKKLQKKAKARASNFSETTTAGRRTRSHKSAGSSIEHLDTDNVEDQC